MTQQEFFTRYSYKPSTDKLGGGSFGKVYKAYYTTLDKYVAIKVAEQLETAGKTFSLLDEFKALESLPDHVNIAKYEQLYTFESPQGVFDYAIMQYYADGNLSQLIQSQKLNAEQKENLALQLLNGIGFLHQHKVVHRDMKPSNILIHNRILGDNKEFIPKITDFGLSKKANTDKGTKFTNSFAAGTYAYSSPEQLKGEELRFNTDLWAYGAIVYEIFTGKTMFNIEQKTGSSALDVREILDNILKSDISTKIAELPPKWQPAITACLGRGTQKRVKTAQEILDILNGNTIILPPEKPDPPKGNEENDNNSGKKKSYKYLLWLIPLVIAFASVLLYFSLNNKPAEAVETNDKTDSVSTTIIDYVMVDTSKSTPIKIDENQTTKTKTKKNKVNSISDIPKTETNSNWRDNYDKIYSFNEGLALVKKNDKYGYVDYEGKLIIPLIYYGGRDFSEGLALVLKKNLKRGYIDKNNKIIIPMIYDDGVDFENGFTRVAIEEFGYFTINKKGECVCTRLPIN